MEDHPQDQGININPTDQPPGTGVNLSLTDIDVLRDRIEQQKANKLKAEQLVSTLSRIKAREKATRRTIKPGDNKIDEGTPNQPTKRSGTNSSNALKEKSNLLKKKLEEDRAKFESKKGQEDLGKVSQIVEHIRVQLEDQDKTIQQIHSNFASTRTPAHVPEVVPIEPEIPAEVKQKITDLEMKVLDLQENLREKDSVISARTQAITLLSEDMARKGKHTLDTLEETRVQMQTMQANFATLEERMNEERTRLREELDAKKIRLQQLDKNYRTAESARFDLSTRVAELQEKIVATQTKNLKLEEELKDNETKMKELKDALENSNKQAIKMKAQFKSKFKAVEEERDMLRKEEQTNEELIRLRERVAELEDEKGNLQLHLVDFDEIQEAGNILKERIAEMEEKLHRQELDLDSHVKAITSLEAEKLDLIEASSKKNAVLREKEEMLDSLQRQIPLIEETKISAEMKCLELEEKLEGYLRIENNGDLVSSELEKAKQKLLEYQDTINELNTKLQSRENFIDDTATMKALQDQSSKLAEWQNRYAQLEEQLSSTLHQCQQLTEEKKQVELDNERLLQECAQLRGTVENLNGILNMRTESSDQEIVLIKQTIAQKEVEISKVNQQNKGLTTEVDNLRHALESTTAELHRLYQHLEDLNQTQLKMEELSANLDNKHKELERATSELDERSRKLSEYKKFHKLKSEDVLRISHELETVTASSQQRISELETALSTAQKTAEDLKREIGSLKADTNTGPKSVDEKLQEQSVKIKKLAANLKVKTKLVKDLEAQKQELESSLLEKEAQINSLRNENDNLIKQLEGKNTLEGKHTSHEVEEKYKVLELEVNTLKEALKLKTEELQCLQNSSSENYETLVQIKELENQNRKLSDISETKSDQLRKMEDEITDLNGLNKSLMSELELMQESYKQDALKNESVLDVFESEMLGNKKDILELSNQLKDVTSKYEQAWAKLQEKDGYIEDLEQQLEKTKSRLLQIESTVEERRRSLELKAEILGAHLCQTEKDKEQLEKYEGELEQKVADLVNREEMLGNIVEKLQEENCELLKSVNEFSAKNAQLNEGLIIENDKVQKLTKEIINLQTSLVNFETVAEENEKIKTQFKELQEVRDNQVKYFQSRLVEAEQCIESETRRLLDKISLVETERHEVVEKLNSLVLEKQMLEEELSNTRQTISDAAKEELEQLKINHENLSRELDKELEKRQDLINRIQVLESQLSKSSTESSALEFTQELNELKIQLDKEIKEKEELKYELLREKAKRQVDDVVSKAEETYFTMNSPSSEEVEKFTLVASLESGKQSDNVNDLQSQLSNLHTENANLRLRLQELEPQARSGPENLLGTNEGEDWTAVSKDEDDGWGWGSKDAMLEHEYIQKQKVNTDLETKVVELQKKVRSFEEDNRRLAEELKAANTKCAKLLRKVKEFKNKSESLERSSRERSVGFDDLDLAMQEELKSQIEKLEKSLKEATGNLNTLQIEREGFLKRIDTLTSGNERLIEMKERQDIEVEMWQRRSNELQNKVQGLEWTIAELHAEQSESKELQNNGDFTSEEKQHFLSNALEMEEKLNALAAENDYLQSLLVELKNKDKKTPPSSSVFPRSETEKEINQQKFEDDQSLHLKQENDRLKLVVLSLEEKLKHENKNTNEDVIEYSQRIENLMKENEWLTSTVEKLKNKTDLDFLSKDNYEALNENYKTLKSENEYLTATVTELHEKMAEIKSKFDKVQTERNNYYAMIQQLEERNKEMNTQANDLLEEDKADNISAITGESPVLFRGFTSSGDNLFEAPSQNVQKPVVESQFSIFEPNTSVSTTQQVDFFDTIQLNSEPAAKHEQEEIQSQHVAQLGAENVIEKAKAEEYLVTITNLKALLVERESELCSLKESQARLEGENNERKSQINEQSEDKNIGLAPWGPLPGMSSEDFGNEKSLHWGAELDMLNKNLMEKDDIIAGLKEKLNSKPSGVFGDEKSPLFDLSPDRNDSFNDLFSQSENSHESQIDYFVEQITNLTKTLHDKEVEIESLNDKKKKYKEMYCSLAKEYNIHSPDQSNADKEQLVDQNFILNQLLEDKETELEIMSQQIDQSKVAKENLQDELCLKLCEMEAANSSFAVPKLSKEMLMPPSQPENIEEVKTLCEEIAELTKLLQEKESEVEILKQQLDESNLEKENLIDEWKKEIENYKEKSNKDAARLEEMEKELEARKDVIISDIDKEYKDEISLKEQQLMNTMNDLHNTRSAYEDVQKKLRYVEESLRICNIEKDQLAKELSDLKTYLSAQKQTDEFDSNMSPFDKVQKSKDDFSNLKVICDQLKCEIEEKDKVIVALQERVKLTESSSGVEERSVEEPVRAVQMKSFASEPFRISTEQSSSDDDSSSRHMEAVQGQMMLLKEVQSLKQVLAMKDAEITRMSIALNEAQESLISSEEEILRHRLDEALYTLHLRDVRCEELALELMQLLEERDSLQLRLSTAIRFTEELRAKSKYLDEAAMQLEGETGSRNSSLTGGEDPDQADNQQLKQKLDQLHNVGYRRDPALQQDQQRRHNEQMHLYSPHPMQDESQQSSGFFGWLFGTSSSGSQDV